MPVTANTIKADVLFVASVVAALGWNFSTELQAVLIGASALIAVAVNYFEARVHISKSTAAVVLTLKKDIAGILPAVEELVQAVPGKTAAKVSTALQIAQDAAPVPDVSRPPAAKAVVKAPPKK